MGKAGFNFRNTVFETGGAHSDLPLHHAGACNMRLAAKGDQGMVLGNPNSGATNLGLAAGRVQVPRIEPTGLAAGLSSSALLVWNAPSH